MKITSTTSLLNNPALAEDRPLRIALDFDGTVTLAPLFWKKFVTSAFGNGFDVRIVTFRAKDEMTRDLQDFLNGVNEVAGQKLKIEFTGREWKYDYCKRIGWIPDIWIDDAPALINHPDGRWNDEQLKHWQESLPNRISTEPEDTRASDAVEGRYKVGGVR